MMHNHGSTVVGALDQVHPFVHLIEIQIHSDQEALKIVSGNHEPFSLDGWDLQDNRHCPLRPPRRGGFGAGLPSSWEHNGVVMSNTRRRKLKEGSPDKILDFVLDGSGHSHVSREFHLPRIFKVHLLNVSSGNKNRTGLTLSREGEPGAGP